jgi:hypothetical protein
MFSKKLLKNSKTKPLATKAKIPLTTKIVRGIILP